MKNGLVSDEPSKLGDGELAYVSLHVLESLSSIATMFHWMAA